MNLQTVVHVVPETGVELHDPNGACWCGAVQEEKPNGSVIVTHVHPQGSERTRWLTVTFKRQRPAEA